MSRWYIRAGTIDRRPQGKSDINCSAGLDERMAVEKYDKKIKHEIRINMYRSLWTKMSYTDKTKLELTYIGLCGSARLAYCWKLQNYKETICTSSKVGWKERIVSKTFTLKTSKKYHNLFLHSFVLHSWHKDRKHPNNVYEYVIWKVHHSSIM